MTKQQQLRDLIDALEAELRAQSCWQATPPSEQALSSQEPFALDSLTPCEWLQWVFITRFRALINANQPLPSGFSMAAYFEQSWLEQPEFSGVIEIIQQIDEVCRHA